MVAQLHISPADGPTMVATPASEEEAPAQPQGGVTAVVDTAEEAATKGAETGGRRFFRPN